MSKYSLPVSQSSLEFSRINSLGQSFGSSVARHPDVLYWIRQYKLPYDNAEFERLFQTTIPIFGPEQAVECPGVQFSPLLLDVGPQLDDFFWLTGLSLVAFGEPKAFTINGGILPREAQDVPVFNGCPTPDGEPASIGSLYHGGPTWQFLYNFLNAYRFRWLIKRYEYLNISASTLGITQMGPAFEGAGCSQVPAMPYIQAANSAMGDNGIPYIFIPQNSAGEDNDCVGAPTADVVYGALELNGGFNRPYCLPQPMLLAPGMHLKMSFELADGDCCYYEGMRRNATITTGLPDPLLTEGVGSPVASAFSIPSGCFSLGLIAQGFVMTDEACWEALTRNRVGNDFGFQSGTPMHSILKGNAAIGNLIQRKTKGGSLLSGVPDNVKTNLQSLMEASG